MIRASLRSALAISTNCRWPEPSSDTNVVVGNGAPTRSSRRRASACVAWRSIRPSGGRLFAAEEDILGDAQMRNQREVLIDDADPGSRRFGGIGEGYRRAVQADFTAVALVQPGDDLDQRAFAGAVGAEQGMHFAVLNVEVDTAKRDDPGKRLAQTRRTERTSSGPTSTRVAGGIAAAIIR